jgi:hypothetical protein
MDGEGGSKHAPVATAVQPAGTGDIIVSRPAAVDKKGVGTTKFNPVSHWRVSKKAITGESRRSVRFPGWR